MMSVELSNVQTDLRSVERMLETFVPLNSGPIRQIVLRRSFSESSKWSINEILTSTEEHESGIVLTSEWSVLLHASAIWVFVTIICSGKMDEEIWGRVIFSIEIV